MAFVEGEWAVLRHDSGGRLFRVGKLEPQLPDRDGRTVHEYNDSPTQGDFTVWSTRLVKVVNKAEGEKLVAVFDFIHSEFNRKRSELARDENLQFDRAVGEYEHWD